MKVKILRILLVVLILVLLLYCTFLVLNKRDVNKQDDLDITGNVSYPKIELNSDSQIIDSYEIDDVRISQNINGYSFIANFSKVGEDDRKIKELKIIFLSENNADLYEDIITFDGSEYYPVIISRQLENDEKLSLTKSIRCELEYEE
jgi:uncharacterized membrane protein